MLEILALYPQLEGKITADIPRLIQGLDADKSTQHFKQSVKNNPGRYIAASSHILPFKDLTFDVVTSSYALFGVATRNKDLLKASFDEAMRVLNIGGTLQLVPIKEAPGLSATEL